MREKTQFYINVMKLALPIMIQNGITNMVGLVDNVMVGTLGTEQMTGVSIINQLLFVNNLAVFGAISGPGIYCAQFFGQGNKEGVKSTFQFKLVICILVAILAAMIFLLGGDSLFRLYLHGSDTGLDIDSTVRYGQKYLMIMTGSLLPFAISQVYTSTMRETGKTWVPMIAGIMSVATDVILNYLFIFGKFGFPRWEVKGAAVATLISRILELFVLVIVCHISKQQFPYMKQLYAGIRMPGKLVKEMTRKGLPIFFNEFLWAGGIAALTQCYSMRGLEVVAGLNISTTLSNIFNVVFVSIGSVTGIMVGKCLGAGDFTFAKTTAKRLCVFSTIISGITGLVLIAFSGVYPNVYDTNETIRILAQKLIIITALFFPLQGLLNAVYFSLRSGGKTVITFLFDSVYSWVVVVSAAFILCKFTMMPILLVFFVIQALDLIKVSIGLILLKKGVWIQNLVQSQG